MGKSLIHQDIFRRILRFLMDFLKNKKDFCQRCTIFCESIRCPCVRKNGICEQTNLNFLSITEIGFIQIEKGLTSHEEDIDFVVGKCDYLENKSRRNNIKVIGIADSEGMIESWEESEKIIKEKIWELLQIQDELVIERAHRVGNRPRKRDDGTEEPRPIVAKFQLWKQKEMVLKKAREVKPQNIKFLADFSQLTLNRRRDQVPELIKGREAGHTAYFVADRLIVKPLSPHSKNRSGWSQRGARRNPTANQTFGGSDAEGDPDISFSC